jgi:hypothetical protein
VAIQHGEAFFVSGMANMKIAGGAMCHLFRIAQILRIASGNFLSRGTKNSIRTPLKDFLMWLAEGAGAGQQGEGAGQS